MAINGVGGSNTLRFTGMATGLDTDEIVKSMLLADKARIDKVEQGKQLTEWKQEAYRDIINDLNKFKSTYFDILSDDYILSANALSGFDIASSDSTVATATAIVGAQSGTYNVNVTQLAEVAKVSGVTAGSGNNLGTKLTDLNATTNKSLQFTISYNDVTNKVITVDNTSGDKTISDVVNKINSETGGAVIARFSELTGKFTLETSSTGTDSKIKVESIDADLSSAIGISTNLVYVNGTNAKLAITPPGEAAVNVEKSTNNFTIDGVSYDLSKVGNTEITISDNVEEPLNKIKKIIEDYNNIVDKISLKLGEKKSYSYKPLTKEQKESMSDEEIENWEKKAKEGLLKNDSALENMSRLLRNAFFDSVEGSALNFSKKDLGLDTSSDIGEGGKILIVDEEKLKDALQNNGQQVMDLFIGKSDSIPLYSRSLDSADKTTRYNEEGIFQRLSDILEDNISTYRDDSGKKGILTEKAGIKDDVSFINNMLTKQIKEKDKMIRELTSRMYDKEERLYKRFSSLETAMNNMNAQSNWLSSQLGGM